MYVSWIFCLFFREKHFALFSQFISIPFYECLIIHELKKNNRIL
ncbi:hypothetical protein LEP1GSC168_1813 [Leptospira santarosai str. HAI134]|uniref:Uncharacterized protein n=1 Tax=Leptospira santarosai str. ZUN179 TaxID=1049985 RepID=M6UTZ7_9LEPT|nr:hypothetical protein LEP1GSC168_1813 [Leptospira santarosai str. HAI134]EMO46246.1 hypothetical protein LEP1GSC187_3750 [Leptospira santarosai str. ZUN179]